MCADAGTMESRLYDDLRIANGGNALHKITFRDLLQSNNFEKVLFSVSARYGSTDEAPYEH